MARDVPSCLVYVVLGIEPRASCMQGKHATSELPLSPYSFLHDTLKQQRTSRLDCSMFVCGILCAMCVLAAHGGQKRTLDLLKLELQIIVNCHMGAGNQTWVLCKCF